MFNDDDNNGLMDDVEDLVNSDDEKEVEDTPVTTDDVVQDVDEEDLD